MKKQFYRSVVVFTLLAATFAAFATPAHADAPAPDEQTSQYEISFMEKMIDHHAMSVLMAQMCITNSIHPELISLCQNMLTSQSADIQMMRTWLQDWYGIRYEPKMTSAIEDPMDPAQFEGWFLKRMLNHHVSAVQHVEDCLELAYHNELMSLCQKIKVAQFQEIDAMKPWLCEWYEVCNFRPNLSE